MLAREEYRDVGEVVLCGRSGARLLPGREDGEAAVVDPKRDVQDYLETAARRGVKIVALFETHPHTDFVSRRLDLAEKTGAPVYVPEKDPTPFPHEALKHGEQVAVGGMPTRDGYEVGARLQETGAVNGATLIALTGTPTRRTASAGRRRASNIT